MNGTSILWSIVLFALAGLAEIGGGWLIWKVVREGAPRMWAVAGALILIIYGIIPTLQPLNQFGRLYAAYGGMFIIFSLLWGWLLDGQRPDRWDVLGASVCLVGVAIILAGPRHT